MPRPASGQVIETATSRGATFALRFRAYGQRRYVTLADGTTREEADQHLAYVLEQVRRGDWRPSEPLPSEPPVGEETFHEFASAWYAAHRAELADKTAVDYLWRLQKHLLPFFARHALRQITVAEVDRYREAKVRESAMRRERLDAWTKRYAAKPQRERPPRPPRPLAPSSINKTLILLGAILDVAEERDLIDRNPMRKNPRSRKLKATRSRPVHLDSAQHIAVLLEAAALLDQATDNRRSVGRRALLATLLFSGVRVGEACALRWRDIDLANGRLLIGRSKTDAGMREVDMLPVLRDELTQHKIASTKTALDAPVFVTRAGKRRGVDNVRQRVLGPAVVLADELLATRDQQPLPEGITAHKLRHTFASILAALNRPMTDVIAQLGHTDPKFTLRVYAHVMRRGEQEREALRALVEGREWAALGSEHPAGTSEAPGADDPRNDGSPAAAGLPGEAAEGTRTLDLLHGKQGDNPEKPEESGDQTP